MFGFTCMRISLVRGPVSGIEPILWGNENIAENISSLKTSTPPPPLQISQDIDKQMQTKQKQEKLPPPSP